MRLNSVRTVCRSWRALISENVAYRATVWSASSSSIQAWLRCSMRSKAPVRLMPRHAPCSPMRMGCHESRLKARVAQQGAALSPRETDLDVCCRRTRSRPSPTSPRTEEGVHLSRGQNLPQANERPWRRNRGRRPIRPAPLPRRSKPSPGALRPSYSCEGMQTGSGLVRWRLKVSHQGQAVGRWRFRSLAQFRTESFRRLDRIVRPMSYKPSPDTAVEQNGSSRDRIRMLCGQNCDRFRTEPSEVSSPGQRPALRNMTRGGPQ